MDGMGKARREARGPGPREGEGGGGGRVERGGGVVWGAGARTPCRMPGCRMKSDPTSLDDDDDDDAMPIASFSRVGGC